jgi:hypothetical protein
MVPGPTQIRDPEGVGDVWGGVDINETPARRSPTFANTTIIAPTPVCQG